MAPTSFWFAGTRLIFERAIPLDGDVAVGTHDAGLVRLLARLGATISFAPQQRYAIVTTSDRRTVTFTIGTAAYTAGGVAQHAAFAPFTEAGDAIVPLYALARALYVEPLQAGGEVVLQPQIGALDVSVDGRRTLVTIRSATPLIYTKLVDTPTRVELAFSGVGSTLVGSRRAGGSLETIGVQSGGSPKNPTTVVSFESPSGGAHEIAVSTSPSELVLTFGGVAGAAAAAPQTVGVAPPTPPPPTAGTAASSSPAPFASSVPGIGVRVAVTSVALAPVDDALAVRVFLTGETTFDWHRLADNRWYVDIANATLSDAGRDEHPIGSAVESVRIRQIGSADAPVVRVALSLRGPQRRVEVAPFAGGLVIAASPSDDLAALRSGSGRTNNGSPEVTATTSETPVPLATPWKFGGSSVPPSGSRLIVLDPGHGGDDVGTAHNGLTEKFITFDIATRLRALLTAQGWTVRMTRERDIDPVTSDNLAATRSDGKPNPDDRAYLQTRVDTANAINARMFISIHVNYSASSAVNGTTFYWYKPEDQGLAIALEKGVIPAAGTNDLGPRHENFYVIRHTTMPAVLIETAFISNPADAARLASPAWLQTIAQGIAAGVKGYAGSPGAQASRADQ